MGIKDERLLGVEPENYLFPVLHGITLFVAPDLDEQFFKIIVNQYCEDLPDQILQAQQDYQNARYPPEGQEKDRVAIAACKKEYSKLLHGLKWSRKPLRIALDQVYKEFGLERGAVFGGKLNGPQSRILYRHAKEMFERFGQIIKQTNHR